MVLYFDSDFPSTLINTLRKLHKLPGSNRTINIVHRESNLEDFDKNSTVVFLMDSNTRGVSIPTKKHFESGYKVFAFRDTEEDVTIFKLSLTILSFWKKILVELQNSSEPFLKTFGYKSRGLTPVKN